MRRKWDGMLMRKRMILTCALTFMLLLGILWGGGVTTLAAGEVTVKMDAVSVSPGETVTAELIMDGTFAAFQGRLVYDTEALTIEEIKATSVLLGSMTMFNQDDITKEFKDGSFVSASAKNMDIKGAVLTFTFRAGSKANGTYSFSIEQFLASDQDGTELTIKAVDTIVDKGILDSSNQESKNQESKNQESKNQESKNQESSSTPKASDSDSDRSSGNKLVIPLIILALTIVGIVLAIVFRAKKRKIK